MAGSPWVFHGISMGFSRDFLGFSRGFPETGGNDRTSGGRGQESDVCNAYAEQGGARHPAVEELVPGIPSRWMEIEMTLT